MERFKTIYNICQRTSIHLGYVLSKILHGIHYQCTSNFWTPFFLMFGREVFTLCMDHALQNQQYGNLLSILFNSKHHCIKLSTSCGRIRLELLTGIMTTMFMAILFNRVTWCGSSTRAFLQDTLANYIAHGMALIERLTDADSEHN